MVSQYETPEYLAGRASSYILKVVDKDGKAYGGFQWPTSGLVVAPDWLPEKVCGFGLHGFLNGEGYAGLLPWGSDKIWIVAEVQTKSIIDLVGKVKVPEAKVVYYGNRKEATQLIRKKTGATKVLGLIESADQDAAVLTGGEESILSSKGQGSTLVGGARSKLTGADWSTLVGGDGSTIQGARNTSIIGGADSFLTGAYGATIVGGPLSTIVGERNSTLTGAYGSTLTGGMGSTLCWPRRMVIVKVGVTPGIEPGVAYQCVDGKVVPAKIQGKDSFLG